MTIRRALLPLALLLATPAVPAAAQDYGYAQAGYDTDGQSVDSIEVFFEPLSHYGRWLDTRYGRVWSPNVGRDWRPYTVGHWEDGAYGATWRSDEPFGWAVFHFGRWAFDQQVGWVWSPDTVWGPGWVAWRDSDDVTGWAPLPPQAAGYAGSGYAVGAAFAFNDWGYDQWYQPAWSYVPRGYLYSRSLRGLYLPFARSRDLWARTRGVTRYDRVDGQIVNHSFGAGRGGDPRRGDGRGFDGRGFDGRGGDGRGFDGRGGDGRGFGRGYDPRGDARGDLRGGSDPRFGGGDPRTGGRDFRDGRGPGADFRDGRDRGLDFRGRDPRRDDARDLRSVQPLPPAAAGARVQPAPAYGRRDGFAPVQRGDAPGAMPQRGFPSASPPRGFSRQAVPPAAVAPPVQRSAAPFAAPPALARPMAAPAPAPMMRAPAPAPAPAQRSEPRGGREPQQREGERPR